MEYLQYNMVKEKVKYWYWVLNLIINGIPSIPDPMDFMSLRKRVLNLIINGIPSIQNNVKTCGTKLEGFKPYYKWNTFNTLLTNV